MGKMLTVKLTAEQQKQIRDASGKHITELNIDVAGTGNLTDRELGQIVGGGGTPNKQKNS